jgi:hypothetical protein
MLSIESPSTHTTLQIPPPPHTCFVGGMIEHDSECDEPEVQAECMAVSEPPVASVVHFRHLDDQTPCMACGRHHASDVPQGQFHAFNTNVCEGFIDEVLSVVSA